MNVIARLEFELTYHEAKSTGVVEYAGRTSAEE